MEPMNASPHHPKVKVSITLPDPIFVAGTHVSGKMEVECRADKGLGINIMMVELFAMQGTLNMLFVSTFLTPCHFYRVDLTGSLCCFDLYA